MSHEQGFCSSLDNSPGGNIRFFKIVNIENDESKVLESIKRNKQVLSQEAKETLTLKIISRLKTKQCVTMPIKSNERSL